MKISRREFLRDTSIIIGGAAIGSIGFINACKGATTTSTQIPTTTETTGSIYIPSREGFNLLPIPGCTSSVADDRMYTIEHVWVKSFTSDKVVIGITDKMQQMMQRITNLQLPKVGDEVSRGDPFGYAEGDKLSVDLLAPVSGTTVQVNNALWAGGGENKGIDSITGDPYVNGWMIVIQLSKLEELNELITPETYMSLNAKPTS
jgi:glycine cleavage system H protein